MLTPSNLTQADRRSVRVGGATKPELLAALKQNAIEINPAGQELFAHAGFTTSEVPAIVEIVETTVGDLGFQDGATIVEAARQRGWFLCPLELGPHLRL